MLKLVYYYSDGCKCCKDYITAVNSLACDLMVIPDIINIDSGVTRHELKGVPTIIIERDGKEVYRSTGNLRYEYLKADVREKLGNE